MAFGTTTVGMLLTRWAAWNAAQLPITFRAGLSLSKETKEIAATIKQFSGSYQPYVAKIMAIVAKRAGIEDADALVSMDGISAVRNAPRWLAPLIIRNNNRHNYGTNQVTCLITAANQNSVQRGIVYNTGAVGNELPHETADYAVPTEAQFTEQMLTWLRIYTDDTSINLTTTLDDLITRWIRNNLDDLPAVANPTKKENRELKAAREATKQLGCQSDAALKLLETFEPETKSATAAVTTKPRRTGIRARIGQIHIYKHVTMMAVQLSHSDAALYVRADGRTDYQYLLAPAYKSEALAYLTSTFDDIIRTIGGLDEEKLMKKSTSKTAKTEKTQTAKSVKAPAAKKSRATKAKKTASSK